MNKRVKRGDMFYADLDSGFGSEQNGHRPVLILSNNKGNKYSNTVIVASITSKITSKKDLPVHYIIDAQKGLEQESIVLLEQVRTIDKLRLREYIGYLNESIMKNIDKALAISVGLEGDFK